MDLKGMLKAGLQRTGFDIVRRRAPELGGSLPDDLRLLTTRGPDPWEMACIFDVGANTGQTATRMATAFPRATIHSFEPLDQTFESLVRNTRQLPNVRPHCVALGSKDGEDTLHLSRDSAVNSLLPTAATMSVYADEGPAGDRTSGIESMGQTTIKVSRLDTFCREQAIDQIDLLKLDTQGYELHVLEGAGDLLAPRHIRAIQLEVLFVPIYEGQPSYAEVHATLEAAGYRIVGLYDASRAPSGFMKWCDALYLGERP